MNNLNEFEVYIAWDDNSEDFQVTYSQQLFQNSRLATIDEIKQYASNFDGFIEATNHESTIVLADGKYKAIWEELGIPENYLYFVEEDGTKHLIY